MNRKKFLRTLCAFSAAAVLLMSSVQKINADETIEIDVSIDTSLDRKAISRYITSLLIVIFLLFISFYPLLIKRNTYLTGNPVKQD